MSETDTPTLTEVLEGAVQGFVRDIRVALPGRITHISESESGRRATVQVDVADVAINEDGTKRVIHLDPLTDVPVMFVGSGSEAIRFDVEPGDPVLLVFASSSIAEWKSASGSVVSPRSPRRHHIADAIAITGLGALGSGSDVLIDLRGGVAKLGGSSATDAPLKAQAHTTEMQTLVESIASAIGGMPGGAGAAATITSALASYVSSATGFTAQKVKVL
jgi:hypothetical protein